MREILALLPRPSRYLGMEEGAVQADPATARLHCALAFPDMYEVAMSYLGQKILYGQLNAMDGVLAERVFTPCREAAEVLREHKVKLATLESDTDLDKTHLIGFSITHELAFTNVLYMLDLAGIPLRMVDRGDDLTAWPVIMAGGGCTLCAEPLAPFMDIMAVGESEVILQHVVALLMQARKAQWTRTKFLQEARHIAGVYVPSLFRENTDGSLTPVFEDYTEIKRQSVADLAQAAYPVSQVTPFGAVHNRLSLEIARGCTRGCRFCQAGMTLRPSRERDLTDIKRLLEDCLARTGYDDVSFLSLSCGDFSGLKTLFIDVSDRCAQEQISLSLPSLRVGSVDGDIMARMAGIRRTGATLAPEAGTQRLRDVINKGVTEEGLIRHIRQLVGYGWQQVKLYFMIGLPTETYDDLDGIVDLCAKVRDCCRYRGEDGAWTGPRLTVTASVSPFVPKTHTPFQWDPQISLDEMSARIRYLREAVKRQKSITLRWHEPAMSHLEGILSRGDRRLADVVEKAFRKGGVFCSWMEDFSLQPWLEALEECGTSADNWTCERALDAPLPWDHLQSGLHRKFLLTERQRALRGAITHDCRYNACRQCGACDTAAGPSLLRATADAPDLKTRLNFLQRDQLDDSPIPVPPKPGPGKKSAPPAIDEQLVQRAVRYRVWHRKADRAAWISQLELQSLLERAMRRAGLPLAFSQGFHPLPLLSFGNALPVGVASLAEWFVITLRTPMRPEVVLERLSPYMLSGLESERIELLPLHGKVPGALEELFKLRCPQDEDERFQASWRQFAESLVWNMERRNKKDEQRLQNIRPLIKNLEYTGPDLVLTMDWREAYLSPLNLVREVMPWADPARIDMIKLAQFVGD